MWIMQETNEMKAQEREKDEEVENINPVYIYVQVYQHIISQ